MESYRKLQQLRNDFDNLRAILDLVRRREELSRAHVLLNLDSFRCRLHDLLDTSGLPFAASTPPLVDPAEYRRLTDLQLHFETPAGRRKPKRVRRDGDSLSGTPASDVAYRPTEPLHASAHSQSPPPATATAAGEERVVPYFTEPLSTRDTSYVTSWEGAVPFVPAYCDAHPVPTWQFRQRARVGRGGRVLVDRVPVPHNVTPSCTVLTASHPLPVAAAPAARKSSLLDLAVPPLDFSMLNDQLQDICIAAIQQDALVKASGENENDGDEVVVRLEDWLMADEQPWGPERFALGPF
jgi:enhancer of polycomb-like protein